MKLQMTHARAVSEKNDVLFLILDPLLKPPGGAPPPPDPPGSKVASLRDSCQAALKVVDGPKPLVDLIDTGSNGLADIFLTPKCIQHAPTKGQRMLPQPLLPKPRAGSNMAAIAQLRSENPTAARPPSLDIQIP